MPTSSRVPARLALAISVVAAVTLGCPFAQPVPGVGQQDGGTITPPRVDTATVEPAGTAILYSTSCPDGGAQFSLQANVIDENMTDTVETRWFVDYDPAIDSQSNIVSRAIFGPPPEDPTQTQRTISVAYPFRPDGWKSTSLAPKHVVELVISNGFAADNGRTPATGYETQAFRWVFLDSPDGGCGP